jgi:hypothetical protein
MKTGMVKKFGANLDHFIEKKFDFIAVLCTKLSGFQMVW